MATIQEEVQKYKAQTQQYDAGRPNAPSGGKPGLKVAQPQQSSKFQPAESAGMDATSASRPLLTVGRSGNDPSFSGKNLLAPGMKGPVDTMADAGRARAAETMGAAKAFASNAFPSPGDYMRQVNAAPAGNPSRPYVDDSSGFKPGTTQWPGIVRTGEEPSFSPRNLLAPGMRGPVEATYAALGSSPQGEERSLASVIKENVGPVAEGLYQKSAITVPGWEKVRPGMTESAQPVAPQLTPDQQVHADVVRDLGARNYRMDIDGLKAAESGMNKPSPDQIKQAILEKNGLINQTPVTARPGTTLSVTPETPRKPLPYNGAFAGGGPEVRAQEALQRKQMEVMAAERADKTLLTAPGSRDYISPMLTEEQMRARQAEIATQRKQDGEDVAAQQINNATIKALDDQAKGITSARNLAMVPYAERRAVINDRNSLMAMNADMQQNRIDDAAKTADRTAGTERAQMEDSTKRAEIDAKIGLEGQKLTSEEKRAMMADSTTRRGQDIGLESSMSQAEAQARERALDRENQRAVAQLRQSQPIDRVKIEGIKAYNKYITDKLTLSPELRNDPKFFTDAMGIYNLTPEDLRSQMMTSVNPEEDPDFPN